MQERLQKILARGGLASRRSAEQWIAEGRVRVNGRIVSELGAKADPNVDKVEVDGRLIVSEPFVYAVLHKPRGVVSTLSDPEGRPSVREYLGPLGARVYPVGRLDFATSGVLLITNDGAFADGLLHPRRDVPKTYVVKVQGVMQPEDLERWENGVRLEDGDTTKPAKVTFLRHEGDKTWFELTITEGRNQQIRRMGAATGFFVMRLSRVSFAGVTSESLRPGELRALSVDELKALRETFGVPKRVRPPKPVAASEGQRRTKALRAAGADRRSPRAGASEDRRPPRAGASDERRPARAPRGEQSSDRRSPRAGASEDRRPPRAGASEERRPARAPRGEQGSDRRGPRAGASEDRRPPRAPRGEQGSDRRSPRAGASDDRRPPRAPRGGQSSERAGKPSRDKGSAPTRSSETQGARYGGGSPGRRRPEVREDWGGGSDRGRSGGQESRGERPGRGGARTRTTGSSGGIGADASGDYRLSKTRRR